MASGLTATNDSKLMMVPRVLAGGPLFLFGLMHLFGAMPMKPLLEAAGFPGASVMAYLVPVVMIAAGALLLSGALARVGGVLAIVSMLGALVTHLKIPNNRWPMPDGTLGDEPLPMMFMAVAVALCGLWVVIKGAGAWSFDGRNSTGKSSTTKKTQPEGA